MIMIALPDPKNSDQSILLVMSFSGLIAGKKTIPITGTNTTNLHHTIRHHSATMR